MNLDELRSVQAKERRKDSVQHLRDSFYDDVAAYIADLRAARDRRAEAVENPFSDDDVRRLSDEIETAEEVAEALYERRVGKVVKLASFAAADMPVETEGLTTQERALFDDLVDRISENKASVLDAIAGDAPVGSSDTPASDGPTADTSPTADATEGASADSAVDASAESAVDASAESATEPNPSAHTADGPGDSGAPSSSTSGADGPLADAMGTSDGDAAAERSSAGETERGPHDGTPPESTRTDDDSSDAESDPTPVDPDPAPPGAPGVSDGGRVTGTQPSDDALSTPGGQSGPESSSTADGPPTLSEPAGASSSGSQSGSSKSSTESVDGTERTTVRITRDVGSILGVDEREYELTSEDVVTLPAANADPLVERDAAERID